MDDHLTPTPKDLRLVVPPTPLAEPDDGPNPFVRLNAAPGQRSSPIYPSIIMGVIAVAIMFGLLIVVIERVIWRQWPLVEILGSFAILLAVCAVSFSVGVLWLKKQED